MNARLLGSVVAALAVFGSTPDVADAAAPTNDLYGNAVTIGSVPFETTVDTTDATASPGDPDCASSSHTAWYRFTPSRSGTFVIDVNGLWDSGGPSLGVFSGPRTSPTVVACELAIGGEDLAGVAAARVTLTAGVRYHVMVGTPAGFPDAPGGFMIVRVVHYVPPAAKVQIMSGTVDRATRTLTLTGNSSCRGTYAYGSIEGMPDIRATVRQQRSTWIARGMGETYPDAGCWPVAPWTMTLTSGTSHPFQRGISTVTARAYECNLWECVTRTTKAKIRLEWS